MPPQPQLREGQNPPLTDLRQASAYFDTAYFRWQGDSAERSARAVVPLIIERFHPSSVVDIGCGSGAWLKVFGEHGVNDRLGIDGPYLEREALRIQPHEFLGCDLSKPFEVDRRYDLAVSLEVAHYLAEEDSSTLVASIVALSDVVLFGAAVPHQAGGPGRNHQWPRWWAAHFAGHGYRAEDWLRPVVWENPQVDWWYAQNTILYVRDGRENDPVRPLVHPGLAQELARPTEPPKSSRRLFLRR